MNMGLITVSMAGIFISCVMDHAIALQKPAIVAEKLIVGLSGELTHLQVEVNQHSPECHRLGP